MIDTIFNLFDKIRNSLGVSIVFSVALSIIKFFDFVKLSERDDTAITVALIFSFANLIYLLFEKVAKVGSSKIKQSLDSSQFEKTIKALNGYHKKIVVHIYMCGYSDFFPKSLTNDPNYKKCKADLQKLGIIEYECLLGSAGDNLYLTQNTIDYINEHPEFLTEDISES